MRAYKAGVLPYVLVLSLVGGILASSFMLKFYLTVKESDFYLDHYLLHRHAQSGLVYAMTHAAELREKEFVPMEMEVSDDAKIEVATASWGVFRLALTRVVKGEKALQKAALFGARSKQEVPSIYVCDLHQPISLAGETRLEGTCYLPEQGLKRAYIEGQNYSGTEMMYGVQKISKRELPELEKEFSLRMEDLFKGNLLPGDSLVEFTSLTGDSIHHDFFNRTLVIRSAEDLRLNEGDYSGNIIFLCPGKISIGKECKLHHVLFFAREIEIENDGSDFQAFAREKIVVKEKSVLLYPTALGILQEDKTLPANFKQEEPFSIILEKDSKVAGCLLSMRKKYDPRLRLLISLQENSLLFGQLYAQDLAEIRGEVCGSVYCEKLYLKTNSSTYENYLLNAKISSRELSPDFCGLIFKEVPHGKALIDEVH
jgi:hypothetical protein